MVSPKNPNKNCIICHANSFAPLYKNTLLKCKNCNFITANLEISNQELEKIYNSNYFKGEEYADYIKEKTSLQKNFQKNIKRLIKKNLLPPPKSILEIGCSYGFFSETIKKQFPTANYLGIDIAKEANDYATSHYPESSFLCKQFLETDFTQNFDSIFMWDVIEHLPHPEAYIKKIHELLSPNGRLFLTTGDIDTLIPKLQKSKWRMIHPPSHLHYFSAKTISKLLKQNHFQIENIHYPAVYRSLKQIFFSLFILNKKSPKLATKFYQQIPENLHIPINTFDIMLVSAKKISPNS